MHDTTADGGPKRCAQIRATVALLAARAALVGFVALALVLAPSVGYLAIKEHDWPARIVMLTVLAGVWCSYFAVAAAHAHRPRRITGDAQVDAALHRANDRLMASLDRHIDTDAGLRALLTDARMRADRPRPASR